MRVVAEPKSGIGSPRVVLGDGAFASGNYKVTLHLNRTPPTEGYTEVVWTKPVNGLVWIPSLYVRLVSNPVDGGNEPALGVITPNVFAASSNSSDVPGTPGGGSGGTTTTVGKIFSINFQSYTALPQNAQIAIQLWSSYDPSNVTPMTQYVDRVLATPTLNTAKTAGTAQFTFTDQCSTDRVTFVIYIRTADGQRWKTGILKFGFSDQP